MNEPCREERMAHDRPANPRGLRVAVRRLRNGAGAGANGKRAAHSESDAEDSCCQCRRSSAAAGQTDHARVE